MLRASAFFAGCVLSVGVGEPVFAQHDPIDAGNPDSVFVEISQSTPGSGSVVAKLYFYNDAQNVASASVGMTWDNPNFMMDSIGRSPKADSAFGLVIFIWPEPWPPMDSINAYRWFHFSGAGIGTSLASGPEPKLIASYYFHTDDGAGNDTLCIDSLTFSSGVQMKFVDSKTNQYKPIWRGEECAVIEGLPTDAEEIADRRSLPGAYGLAQNYPNPFNASTVIQFTIPERAHAVLSVYNQLGRKISTLVDAVRLPGEYTVHWDGTDSRGNPVASGVYIYRLTIGGKALSRKMVLLK